MGINVTRGRIPVKFELTDDSDSRFNKVKVWIAHTGENLNNSYFSKETLEEMAVTLPKIPIVGYIEADEDGEDDFSDHRQEIVIKSGEGVDVRYAGHAYGFIPEDCNAQFEVRDGKEWLTAEGYIWTKFQDAFDIFNADSGIKSQSMEISDAEGEVDDIGRMVITSAVFSALCILGRDVAPAMTGSTIEFFSKKEQYQFELNEMMKEFNVDKEKGESNLPEDKEDIEIVDEVIEADEAGEVADETGETDEVEEIVETTELEEDATIDEEEFEVKDEAKEIEPEPAIEAEEPEEVKAFSIKDNKVSLNFQLSHEDQRIELYEKLEEKIERGYHYILAMYNNHAIVEQVVYDEDWEHSEEKTLRVNFGVENDDIAIGEVEEVFPMYLTATEKVTIDNQREEIEQLNSRLEELSEYKESTELEAKEDFVSEYAKDLKPEAVEVIRENFSAMTLEDVEKEVALQLFKESQLNKEDKVSVSAQNFSATKEKRYGSLDKFFK